MSDEHVSLFGHAVRKADLIKAVGLLAFIGLTAGIVVALWPSLSVVFEPNGVDRLIEDIQSRGAAGVVVLLGLQLLQIIVAFIPGEVVQIAAGMLYGPLGGSAVILVGCVISSSIIYLLVSRLGAPFVRAMIDKKHLEKVYEFERSGKLSVTVFILFLIPGMPKDVFTYLVPLTSMRMRTFLALTTLGRIPGVVVSTYAAAGLAEGDIATSLAIFAVGAAIMIVGLVFRNRIMALVTTARMGRGFRRADAEEAVADEAAPEERAAAGSADEEAVAEGPAAGKAADSGAPTASASDGKADAAHS